MLRQPILTKIWPLTLAAALLAPLAASAQASSTPAAPAAPSAPMAPKNANRVNGKITAVDAAAKTVTLSHHKKTITLSVPDGAKIFKIGERRNPSGTFADLTVGARIMARTNGDADKPVATQVHFQAPKNAAPATPDAPIAPVPPTPPAAP